jgi:hypothetical protein
MATKDHLLASLVLFLLGAGLSKKLLRPTSAIGWVAVEAISILFVALLFAALIAIIRSWIPQKPEATKPRQ